MSYEFAILAGTAAAMGFFHTIFGPDHYLPFVVLSKARRWSGIKTFVITLLCGIGHIFGSVVLGFAGIALGIVVINLEMIESIRGELAAWFLIIFGFAYFVWGICKICNHSHKDIKKLPNLTPWVLFTIFVFGPCEPLIPLLMYPAAKIDMLAVATVTLVFGLTTIATMLGMVAISSYGLSLLAIHKLEKYSHVLAGLTIFLCGIAIKFLGL